MARILLDTTVVIDLLRGAPSATARFRAASRAGDAAYVCAINVEETVRGLQPGQEQAARSFFAGVRWAPLRQAEGWQAGEWRRDHAGRGTTLSQSDCLVAAAAVSIGARLATGNPRHFPMAELSVEHWPAGA